MDWVASIPFLAAHMVALVGIFVVPFAWKWVALALGLYVLRMFAITAGYHRYFSHRAYKTSRPMQFALAWLGTTATQKGVLRWASLHREHHRLSDQPGDVHSPVQDGFWFSHVGWVLQRDKAPTDFDRIKDFAKYPELVWIDRWHLLPPTLLAVGLFVFGGWSALVWGYFVSTVFLWHGTFTVNSLAHVFGSQRFDTDDQSRNNFWIALITMGEGWHNNHHFYQSTANQGFYWWEIDVSYYSLKLLNALGLVRDLRKPPDKVIVAGLAARAKRLAGDTPVTSWAPPRAEPALAASSGRV